MQLSQNEIISFSNYFPLLGSARNGDLMLRQSFTYQLASLAEDAVGPAGRLFERRFGLDVHELRVLRLIGDQPGVTFTTLAKQTRFERSATSRILSRLVKANLVEREIDDNDARQFRLHITSKGKALRERADPLSLEIEKLILSSLSQTEQKNLHHMLERLGAYLHTNFVSELERLYPDVTATKRKKKA